MPPIADIIAWVAEKLGNLFFRRFFNRRAKSVAEKQAENMSKPERSWSDDVNRL